MKWTPKTVAITAAVVLAGAWYLKKKAGETVQEVGQAINPVNHDNIFNQGAESLYSAVTGSENSPGVDFADWNQEFNEKYYKYTPLGLLDQVSDWWNE